MGPEETLSIADRYLLLLKYLGLPLLFFNTIWLIYNISTYILIVLFARNKINIPENLPISIITWLNSVKSMSQSNVKAFFLENFFRQILIYTVVVISILSLYLVFVPIFSG